jgi:hypothetical protein
MDRIDELIKQATHDCMGVPVLDKRMFAQLIVQECVGVCEEYYGTAGDQAAQYIGQGIKEHFGVE